MNKIIEDELIQGLHNLIGVNKKLMKEYVKDNDIRHILDHPAVLGMNARQTEKLYQLKDFINAYCVLRAEHPKKEILFIQAAKDLFLTRMGFHCEYESVMAVFLDRKKRIISFETISQGSVRGALMLPQKIAKRAVVLDADSLIVGHNHPGLETSPSIEDVRITKTLLLGLRFLDVELLDHIIIGGNQALSMREEGVINFEGTLNIDNYLEPAKEKQEQAVEDNKMQMNM